jgi:DNA ligase-1
VLSDYTFAVRDEETGRLLNVGKAYSGLTDAEIATMTRFFLDHTLADHGHVRLVEPNTVIEVAFDAILRSTRHDMRKTTFPPYPDPPPPGGREGSGFALRFPRIVRLRQDKPPAEIDTLSRVQELHERYFARGAPLSEVAEPS